MNIRLLSVIQMLLGVLLFIAGIGGTATYLISVEDISDDVAKSVRGFAEQVNLTSQLLADQQAYLGDAEKTATAYGEAFKTLKNSSQALAAHTDDFGRVGKDIEDDLTAFGSNVQQLGDAFDFDIPCGIKVDWGNWHGVPYPKAVYPEMSDAVRRRAKVVSKSGDDMKHAGKTVNSAITAVCSEYAKDNKAFADVADSSIQVVAGLKNMVRATRNRNLPQLITTLRATNQQLNDVADKIKVIGPLMMGAGCIAAAVGLVCFLNGIGLWLIDGRLRPAFASHRVA